MTYKEITDINAKVRKYIADGRMRDAFRLLINTTEATMLWEIGDAVKRIERNYAYMLKYLTGGADDPGRDDMYAGIVDSAYSVLDELTRRLLKKEHSTLYYDTVRFNEHAPRPLDRLLATRASMVGTAPAKALENIESDIFRSVWTVLPLRRSDADALVIAVLDPSNSYRFRSLVISAITLGLLEFFDPARMEALMEIYETGQTGMASDGRERLDAMEITSMALCGILLALFKYRSRPLPRNISERLASLGSKTRWHSDLKIAFTELIRTRDTERINATMRDEILPEMMKMRPDIEKGIREGMLDPENLEANPEWEEMLKKSGVADRIRELSELQQEGADVFMSTFSHLKNFPFFNNIANWFIPFDATRSEVAEANVDRGLTEFVENIPFLVAGDKYSFVFSLGMLAEEQRRLAFSQFEMQGRQINEEMAHTLETGTPDDLRQRTVRGYLATLYRFYNLFRRKGEFYNPFAQGVNLLRVPALAKYINDADLLRVIAEFFFRKSYWTDAADAFERLNKIDEPDGALLQKLGYSYRRIGNIDKALNYYLQAELFTPDNVWLTQNIAAAYRDMGNLTEAARYYLRLTDMEPENAAYVLQYGYILMRQNLLEQATRQFYKAEFLDSESTRASRPLAWTLFLAGRYEDSRRYYDRVLADNPTATDWLNFGHLAMAEKRYNDALSAYGNSLRLRKNDTEGFLSDLHADRDVLRAAGVADNIVQMIADALMYASNNPGAKH